MAMTFDNMLSRLAETQDPDVKIRILVGYLRDNTISDTIAAAALVNAIPTTDPADDGVTCWFDEGVLKVSGASA